MLKMPTKLTGISKRTRLTSSCQGDKALVRELGRRVVQRRPVVLVDDMNIATAADQKLETFGAPEKLSFD